MLCHDADEDACAFCGFFGVKSLWVRMNFPQKGIFLCNRLFAGSSCQQYQLDYIGNGLVVQLKVIIE
jgi:hypothetical protein